MLGRVYETASGVRSLKYLVTPYGRAVKNGSTWDYEYNLTDHLGNVRAVIRKGSNNLAELVQQKHYYPFGMEISNISLGTGTNKYLYNGKEIQDDFSLYWYDYGARMYDPSLGRFHSIDNSLENYYSHTPYNYVGNNPIKRVDPDGNDWWDAVVGTAIGVATNVVPGSTSLRNSYTPTDAADYNNALRSTDAAAMVIGEGMVKGGAGAVATGGAVALAGGTVSLSGVGATVGVPAATVGGAVAGAGAATAAGGVVLMANGTANASAGYNYGKDNSSSQTSTEVKTRQSKGGDGATSKHIIEKDASGKTVSKTHQVTGTDGKVVHQHQDFVSQTPQQGQKPVTRQFPDEWVKFPNVNAK